MNFGWKSFFRLFRFYHENDSRKTAKRFSLHWLLYKARSWQCYATREERRKIFKDKKGWGKSEAPGTFYLCFFTWQSRNMNLRQVGFFFFLAWKFLTALSLLFLFHKKEERARKKSWFVKYCAVIIILGIKDYLKIVSAFEEKTFQILWSFLRNFSFQPYHWVMTLSFLRKRREFFHKHFLSPLKNLPWKNKV